MLKEEKQCREKLKIEMLTDKAVNNLISSLKEDLEEQKKRKMKEDTEAYDT